MSTIHQIYELFENNPIISTYCKKKILNFQIYITYDLNKMCRNIYTYGIGSQEYVSNSSNCLIKLFFKRPTNFAEKCDLGFSH